MSYPAHCYSFDQLSKKQLYDLLQLRSRIFVVEQNIVYLDIDGLDDRCHHLCLQDGDKLIGAARILPPGLKDKRPAIGRLVLDSDYRGRGLGAKLMMDAVRETFRLYASDSLLIEAQAQLKAFYESLGYIVITEPYMLEGLMHIKMTISRDALER
ncbi:MAG: GNAT family N-acetyltransferase [Alphaproteobacteria bacterium]|nr:GNAT family N-acetyltransferase [Alphaproteobacteria bacterium]